MTEHTTGHTAKRTRAGEFLSGFTTLAETVTESVRAAIAQTRTSDTGTGYVLALFEDEEYRFHAVWTDDGYELSVTRVHTDGTVFANVYDVDEDLTGDTVEADTAADTLYRYLSARLNAWKVRQKMRDHAAQAEASEQPAAVPDGTEIVHGSVCDGGMVSCGTPATWALRIHEHDAWVYACGRHLAYLLTYACDGERAAFDVRRITTDES